MPTMPTLPKPVAWRWRSMKSPRHVDWQFTEVPPDKWGTDLFIEYEPLYSAECGKAIAEACALICMSIVDSDDPAQCAAAIREAAKELCK